MFEIAYVHEAIGTSYKFQTNSPVVMRDFLRMIDSSEHFFMVATSTPDWAEKTDA